MTGNEASTATTASAKPPAATTGELDKASTPFHILMLPDGDTIHPKREIDQTLCHDYLGKRYEAYKFKNDAKKEDDRIWSGASTVSCHMPHYAMEVVVPPYSVH